MMHVPLVRQRKPHIKVRKVAPHNALRNQEIYWIFIGGVEWAALACPGDQSSCNGLAFFWPMDAVFQEAKYHLAHRLVRPLGAALDLLVQ